MPAAPTDPRTPGDAVAPRVEVLVAAYDEAPRVARVVAAARDADVGPVTVVDDGSADDTADVAEAAGARVVRLPHNVGKGGALHAGATASDADLLVLLDADLEGLAPAHVHALLRPVLEGTAATTRGVFRGARVATTGAQRLAPGLGGQRAVPRNALLAVPDLAAARFGVEVALERSLRRQGMPPIDVPLPGVGQVMKEEKRGFVPGVRARLAMYADVLRAIVRRA